ncbi:hypothetical protein BKA70DRAFT_1233923 [Coprinopsis sp. MPI-PUGE-AT-0042]|nr:hypothetical protein BKA70DRAFT_1233923 [Coprinopsis sp. MPI-PUGE-AT-0042]
MADDNAFQNEKVVLTKGSDGQIIGWSNIDDYIYRPSQYNEYSMKRPRQRKGKKPKTTDEGTNDNEENDGWYLDFEEGHPQQKSHELKQDDQLWDEAWRASSFDRYTAKLIDNINLRYECMDAKDNLKSQHRKKYRTALGLPSEDDDDFEDIDDFDDGLDDAINADGSIDNHEILGKNRLSRLNQMRQAQSIVTATGWTDDLQAQSVKDGDATKADSLSAADVAATVRNCTQPVMDSIVDGIDLSSLTSCKVETYLTPASWKNIVKSKRAEVLEKKNKHAPPEKKKNKKGALH